MCQPGRPGPHGDSHAADADPRGLHVIARLVGELAVRGPARRVEVDVARVVGRGVRVAALDEHPDELLHLLHARGRAGLVGRRQDAERRVGGRELELHAVGQRPPLLELGVLFIGGREDLVVDVGDVAHEGDVVAAIREPAPHDVVGERAPEVPDVRARLHRGTADVHADASLDEGHEVTQGLVLRVVESHGHPPSLPAAVRSSVP